MPKSLVIEPERFLERSYIRFPALPVYRYDVPLQHELAVRGKERLIDVLRHMLMVREFENMLDALRTHGRYRHVEYRYVGPAHLSVGQEAVAVGTALALRPEDRLFGNHRSHGEFIAKALAAIADLTDDRLEAMMAAHGDGALLDCVERHLPGAGRRRAENFILFGLLGEILTHQSGFNRGMGGSMHAFYPPVGAWPNNAIVGASAGIATGAALYSKLHGEGIAVATAGDGATGCGPVWEAMNFAAMSQYHSLWEEPSRGALPVLYLFVNNFYAMGGQTSGETMGWDRLARIAGAINPLAMHAETIDGTRPLAVAEAVAAQRERLLRGEGPALLDVECYRTSGHSTSDANAYRSREEMQAWKKHDGITRYADELQSAGIITDGTIEQIAAEAAEQVLRVTEAVTNPRLSQPMDLQAQPMRIGELMFAPAARKNTTSSVGTIVERAANDTTASVRLKKLARKSRSAFDKDGTPLSPLRAVNLRDALFEAVLNAMRAHDRLIVYGEECREWGGAFGVYNGLAELFPHSRLFNAPISEAAIVATAVGYAMSGGRALVELMYADFIGRAGDEIFNQLAKWQGMSGGLLRMPVVLRCSVGSKYGAQHSQDWSSLVAHVPGLKVFYPATPYDAKGLLGTALAGDDPVVFFESQRLYDTTERFASAGVPTGEYHLPAGVPDIKRPGRDLTLLTIGPALYPALGAAETLASSHGLEAEVIDARCLVPFDYSPVLASVQKTGRIVLVTEACERGSFAMTLASTITRHAFAHLKRPPRVLGAPNWVVPGAELEHSYFPQAVDIVDAVFDTLYPERPCTRQGHRRGQALDLARRGL